MEPNDELNEFGLSGHDADATEQANAEKTAEKRGKKTKPPARSESKFQRFLRRLLYWTLGLLAVFALGVGTTWVTLVRDLREEKSALQDQVDAHQVEETEALESLREEYQAEVDALQAQIDAFDLEKAEALESLREEYQAKIDAMQAQVDEANLHVLLVNALVDVSSARVALGQNDLVGVRAALAGTDDRLATLQETLGADGTTAVQAIRDQLADLLQELEQDTASLDRELERMISNLLALERSIFAE